MQLTQVSEWKDGQMLPHDDALAAEEPLEIRIGGAPLTVTMRTPGHDEELAAGFLLTEGIVENSAQIAALRSYITSASGKSNGIEVELRDCEFDPAQLQRNFFAASSCGICGKASIDAIRQRGLHASSPGFTLDPELLCTLPDKLREAQTVFSRTGGLHAAALFDASGNLVALREDIGRHNAVDKIVGWAALNGQLPLSQYLMLVSGRGGFEIVQKALAAGLPILASVSAPSSLAVQLARELGLTLLGFLRGRRFVVYSGEYRLVSSPSAP
jgi:FdhD protein